MLRYCVARLRFAFVSCNNWAILWWHVRALGHVGYRQKLNEGWRLRARKRETYFQQVISLFLVCLSQRCTETLSSIVNFVRAAKCFQSPKIRHLIHWSISEKEMREKESDTDRKDSAAGDACAPAQQKKLEFRAGVDESDTSSLLGVSQRRCYLFPQLQSHSSSSFRCAV